MAKKLIPCRVCGKMFKPCSYCQEHSDTFRWRNFACSIECAKKYITETMEYRDAQKNISTESAESVMTTESIKSESILKNSTTKKKNKRAVVTNTEEKVEVETVDIENDKTETTDIVD